jgi:hypothetical protein
MDDYSTSPAELYAVKEQVLTELADLDRAPLAIVQTEPREGTRLPYGPAMVLVRGQAEPGAQVTVNGRAVAVAPDGAFADSPGLDPKRQTVTIRVKTAAGEKTVTRSFRVVE